MGDNKNFEIIFYDLLIHLLAPCYNFNSALDFVNVQYLFDGISEKPKVLWFPINDLEFG